jgi:hypothetical protein
VRTKIITTFLWLAFNSLSASAECPAEVISYSKIFSQFSDAKSPYQFLSPKNLQFGTWHKNMHRLVVYGFAEKDLSAAGLSFQKCSSNQNTISSFEVINFNLNDWIAPDSDGIPPNQNPLIKLDPSRLFSFSLMEFKSEDYENAPVPLAEIVARTFYHEAFHIYAQQPSIRGIRNINPLMLWQGQEVDNLFLMELDQKGVFDRCAKDKQIVDYFVKYEAPLWKRYLSIPFTDTVNRDRLVKTIIKSRLDYFPTNKECDDLFDLEELTEGTAQFFEVSLSRQAHLNFVDGNTGLTDFSRVDDSFLRGASAFWYVSGAAFCDTLSRINPNSWEKQLYQGTSCGKQLKGVLYP